MTIDLDALEALYVSGEFTLGSVPNTVLKLITEVRKARAERDWLTEQIGGNLPCPPYSDVIDEADCDNECCEECWLKAASKAVEGKR